MSGAVYGLLAGGLLAGTSLTAAATLRLRTLPELLLGAYVLAFAEIVVLMWALTPFHRIERPILLGALALVFAACLAVWALLGRPLGALGHVDLRLRPRSRSDDVVVAIAGSMVALAALYALVLVFWTPPVTWDSLRYHLMRAAMWAQEGSVGYVADSYDSRLNANPPNGEIALAFVLEVTRNERLAGLVQFAAWLACGVAVVALARAVGLRRHEVLVGSFVFMLLPIVVLQSSTTQNDLVVASVLASATVFLTGRSAREGVLAACAVALAVGTKVTAAFALPILFAVAVGGGTKDVKRQRLLALLAGTVVGSYWYGVNIRETGDPLGDTPDRGYVQLLDPVNNGLAALARVVDVLEVTGVREYGVYVYPSLALVFSLILVATWRAGRITARETLAGSLLVLAPLAVFPASYLSWRVFAKLHDLAGSPTGFAPPDIGTSLLPIGGWSSRTLASETQSWYGPVGILLVVGVALVAVILVRQQLLPKMALIFAFAPFVWLLLLSITLGYDPWQGRFFVYPFALSAALWGVVLRVPPVAWATCAVTGIIASLSLAQYDQKPLPMWTHAERWELQSRARPGVSSALRFIERRVPEGETVAVALGPNDWGFPAFGPRVGRRVVLVPLGSSASNIDASWLIASQARAADIDEECWRRAHLSEETVIFERMSTMCERETTIVSPAP